MNLEVVDDDYNVDPSPARNRHISVPPLAAALAILAVGWGLHSRQLLDPAGALSYALGMIGVVLLLASHIRTLFVRADNGKTALLTRLALAGFAGAAMVAVHGNFQLGNLTSALLMGLTALITLHGMIGWCLLAGRPIGTTSPSVTLDDIQTRFQTARTDMTEAMAFSPALRSYLEQVESQEWPEHRPFFASFWRVRGIEGRQDNVRQRAMRFLRQLLESRSLDEDWTADQLQAQLIDSTRRLGNYLSALRHLAECDVKLRLLRLWRVQHGLVTVSLLCALAIHVFAVHAY